MGELREKYRAVFGEETRSCNGDFLRKRIAWRIQALAEGGLSERARRRAEELANDADLRIRPPRGGVLPSGAPTPGRTVVGRLGVAPDRRRPMPGTVLTREYRGETVTVTVLDGGFEYEGQMYRSLTAVAKAVTGAHWNGFHFSRSAAGEVARERAARPEAPERGRTSPHQHSGPRAPRVEHQSDRGGAQDRSDHPLQQEIKRYRLHK